MNVTVYWDADKLLPKCIIVHGHIQGTGGGQFTGGGNLVTIPCGKVEILAKDGSVINSFQIAGAHITPRHEDGKTVTDNCQMLCKDCNRRKSGT